MIKNISYGLDKLHGSKINLVKTTTQSKNSGYITGADMTGISNINCRINGMNDINCDCI
jgi:hypothetical protein